MSIIIYININNIMKFTVKLFKELKNLKLTQKKLAIIIGVSPQTISNWFARGMMPRYDTALKLVKFFNNKITMKDCGHGEA